MKINKEVLEDLYFNEGYSITGLEEYFNISRYKIEMFFKENNIRKKSISETLKGKNTNRRLKESLKNNDYKKIIAKRKETNLLKYGVENAFQSEEVKEKIKQTNLEKYGVENAFQNEEVKEKAKQTNLEKYGVENAFQNEEVKEKIKQTNLEKYGSKNPYAYRSNLWNDLIESKYGDKNFNNKEKIKETHLLHSKEEIKKANEKRKESNLLKYCVENPMQNEEIKEKAIEKMILNNGGIGFQIESVFEKAKENQFKKYKVVINEKEFILQGYEPIILEYLINKENINVENIFCHRRVPTIYYYFNGKEKRHFPDFYIYNENRIIEVKGEFTLYECNKNCLEIQKLKMKYAKKQGYIYQVYLYKRNKSLEIINEF